MRYAIAALVLIACNGTAYAVEAETYNYTCRLNGKPSKVKVDERRNTLTWMGKVYSIKIEESCANFGWHAEREGESFNFCTATQGYADFHQGDKLVQCDQAR